MTLNGYYWILIHLGSKITINEAQSVSHFLKHKHSFPRSTSLGGKIIELDDGTIGTGTPYIRW